MAIAGLDAVASVTSVTTQSFTVSSGSDRLLVVTQSSEAGGTNGDVTACDYGGQAAAGNITADFGFITSDIWWFDEADIAAASGTTITWTYNGSGGTNVLTARSFSGVDQTTPVPESHADGASSSPPNPLTTIDITADDADAAVYACGGQGNASASDTWASPLVAGVDVTNGSMAHNTAEALAPGTGNVPVELTFVTAPNRRADCSIEIAAAAAGGGGGTPIHYYRRFNGLCRKTVGLLIPTIKIRIPDLAIIGPGRPRFVEV